MPTRIPLMMLPQEQCCKAASPLAEQDVYALAFPLAEQDVYALACPLS